MNEETSKLVAYEKIQERLVVYEKKDTYISLKRNEVELLGIAKRRPTAYILLSLIAIRARRSNQKTRYSDDLDIGEAFIGDWKNYTNSEQVYRNDKTFLIRTGFITVRRTPKGTIAKLVDSTLFDINADETNTQSNALATVVRTPDERSTNTQGTTNNNVKNVKNEKKVNIVYPIFPKSNSRTLEYSFKKFKDDYEAILQEASEKYPNRDCKKAIDYFINQNEAKNYKYKNYKIAFFNWVREDKYNQFNTRQRGEIF